MKIIILALLLLPQATDPIRPDPKMTPGETVPVTIAQVCKPGYAGSVRNVPAAEAAAVYAEYGIQHVPGTHEVDHLISLELGGSNGIKNLWIETYSGQWNARQKDKLENYLHREVCAGRMSLADAQHAISSDWIAAFQKAGLK